MAAESIDDDDEETLATMKLSLKEEQKAKTIQQQEQDNINEALQASMKVYQCNAAGGS